MWEMWGSAGKALWVGWFGGGEWSEWGSGVGLVVGLVLALPAMVLLVETVAAGFPLNRGPGGEDGQRLEEAPGDVVVLIPSHDEAGGIGQTVAAVRQQMRSGDRVLVIADNCTDETARVARAAGAEVVERHEPSRRGKGYALARGVEYLRGSGGEPAVVIVLDADCRLSDGAVGTLRRWVMAFGRPIQCRNVVTTEAGADGRAMVSALAFAVRNVLRPKGLAVLGGPCQLMGTGMALPWRIMSEMDLANGELTEDMRMGFEASRLGAAPMWCHVATVWSEQPTDEAAARSQRRRWEQGHLRMMVTAVPRMIWSGLKRGNGDMIVQGIDAAVPPLGLLGAVLAVGTVGLLGLGMWTGEWSGAVVTMGAMAAVAGTVVMGWWVAGRDRLPARSLLAVPAYLGWKLKIYAAMAMRPVDGWVRTPRNSQQKGGISDASRTRP